MKVLWLSLAVILLFGCSPETSEVTGPGIEWVKNYRNGIDQARKSDKAAMLFFTADWCPPCVELKKHVFTDASVIAASKTLVNIYIDVDQQRQIMRDYRVRGIPAVFFLDPSGATIAEFSGPRSARNFVKHMQAAADAAGGNG